MKSVHPSKSDAVEADYSRIFWNAAVIFLIFCGFVVIISQTISDTDLWGHLRFGLDRSHLGNRLVVIWTNWTGDTKNSIMDDHLRNTLLVFSQIPSSPSTSRYPVILEHDVNTAIYLHGKTA